MSTPGPLDYLPKPVMPRVSIQRMLEGQTALVTGASSGIGRGIAQILARAGANVVVNYIGARDKALEVVAAIEAEGARGVAIQADVSNETQVQAMFREALERFGALDILVNNAGLQQDAPFHELTLAQWN